MKSGKAACGLWKQVFFGDHDTPHQQPTNAKFDNKPLMKKGQNKRGGTTNADDHGNTTWVAST